MRFLRIETKRPSNLFFWIGLPSFFSNYRV